MNYDPDNPPMPPDDPASAVFMEEVDGMKGYDDWGKNGDLESFENSEWRKHLPLAEDGKLYLDSKKAFELIVPNLETHNGVKISSSRIRNLLNQGDIIGAKECLGRDYMLSGTVISGEKLGRKLGYPTANIRLEYDYPLDGVYLTRTVIEEKNYVGLASLGNKPTFNGSEKILEVFILDFDKDIYSQNIEVYFLEEIRKQIKFSNEDELIKQMNEDHKYAIINSKKYGI